MDPDSLDKHDWIPEEDRVRLRELMEEWSGPGRGYVFLVIPPAPGRAGYAILQPMKDPNYEGKPG